MAEQDWDLPAARFCMEFFIFDWFYKGFNLTSGQIENACFTNVLILFADFCAELCADRQG